MQLAFGLGMPMVKVVQVRASGWDGVCGGRCVVVVTPPCTSKGVPSTFTQWCTYPMVPYLVHDSNPLLIQDLDLVVKIDQYRPDQDDDNVNNHQRSWWKQQKP